MATDAGAVEHTTAIALEEKAKLIKSLRRFDMLFFTVCALVGLDTLGQVSSFGAADFIWLVVLAVLFVFPYALAHGRARRGFTQEGGPYEWMKLAWGRLLRRHRRGALLGHEPALGRRLARLHRDRRVEREHLQDRHRTFGDYVFKLIFIWISIGVAIVSLRYGKWIPNVGAILRVGVLGFFSVTVLIYGIEHGVARLSGRRASARRWVDLPRARAAAALQLRRLRAPERRRRGDAEPAA